MSDSPHGVYWDACVFLDYINANPQRLPAIEACLEELERAGEKVYTSVLSIVEVAYAVDEQHHPILNAEALERIDSMWTDRSLVELVELHEEIARLARDVRHRALARERSIKPADAIHLATAEWLGAAQFHTYDERLLRLTPWASFSIDQPHTNQPPLF